MKRSSRSASRRVTRSRSSAPKRVYQLLIELDEVEGVSAQVVNEACAFDNFIGFHVEILDDNFFHALKNVRHGYLSRYACRLAHFRTIVLRLAHTTDERQALV